MDFKYSKNLAFIGAVLGIIAGLNKGIADIAQLLGYALGLTIFFLALGFIFDLVGSKFGKK